MTTSPGSNGSKWWKFWSGVGRFLSSVEKWVPYVVAIGVLVGFGFMLQHMLGLAKADEAEWARYVYLFGSIEAVAFAATGFLFGKEVHREQAKKAEERADEAQQQVGKDRERADEAKKQADADKARADHLQQATDFKRRAFDDAVNVKKGIVGVRKGMRRAGSEADFSQEDIAELYLLAKKLFLES
jgi:hypothetical protein